MPKTDNITLKIPLVAKKGTKYANSEAENTCISTEHSSISQFDLTDTITNTKIYKKLLIIVTKGA